MKICVVATIGGHLGELLMLNKFLSDNNSFIITNPTDRKLPFPHFSVDIYPFRPHVIVKCFIQSFKILFRERPKLIISTGAEIAVPCFIIAKFFGIPTIFIETVTRLHEPTQTGKLLYYLSSIFLVQHKGLLKKYGKKAQYQGRVF